MIIALIFSMTASQTLAQTNNGIFFQAVARDNFSNPAKDRQIYVESSIIQTTSTGTKVLIELHKTTTDAMGVFSINLGNGTRTGGSASSLGNVDWSKGPFFLNLKIAITPFSASDNWNYTKELVDMGTTSFGTVPFALYSASSAKVDNKLDANDTTAMLKAYAKAVKVQSLETAVASKLTAADTLTMLAPYAKAAYTIDSSFFKSQLATKLNIADTIFYTKQKYTDSVFAKKLNIADTIYYSKQKYTDSVFAKKLNIADSTLYVTKSQLASYNFSSGGSGVTIDTSSLSNRINLKASRTEISTAIDSLNTKIVIGSVSIASNTASITSNTAAINTINNKIASSTASITANTLRINELITFVTDQSITVSAADETITNNLTANTTAINALNTKVLSNTASITALTSNTIPYTGAKGSVDLGAYDLKVNGLTIGLGAGSFTNTVVGNNALSSNTTGYYNNAFGYLALLKNTSGISNTAIGAGSLMNNTVGYSNTAIGAGSLMNNIGGNSNLALGIQALNSNNSGYSNTGIGSSSLFSNTTGNWNVGLGTNSLYYNQTGSYNFAIGSSSLYKNMDGNFNVAIGNNALFENLLSSNNVAIGSDALLNSLGAGNTAIGISSLAQNNNGTNNTAIGYYTDVTADNIQNSTAIGFGALVNTSNSIQLGNNDITNVKTKGMLTAGDVTYPNTHGSNGQFLSTTGTGALIWSTITEAPATSSNTVSTIVKRDASGNFSAGTINATSINTPIYASTPQSLIDASTISWNPALGLNASVTLAGNRTLSFSSIPVAGSYGTLVVTQDATGGRTLILPSTTNLILGSSSTTNITLSTAASAKDILNFYYDGTNCYWNIGQGYGAAATPALTLTTTGTGAATLSGTTLNIPLASSTVNAGSISGTIAVANGGTGQSTIAGIQSSLGLAGTKVAIGATSGQTSQGAGAVAVGNAAGNSNQGSQSVAIGYVAGQANQGANSVAIGSNAAQGGQGTQSVAIGIAANSAANNATGIGAFSSAGFSNSTAIGYQAGTTAANTIQLGADGVTVVGSTAITNVRTSGTLTAGTVTYPNTHGTTGQVLSTTGSGTLTWTTASAGAGSTAHTVGEVYGGGIVFYITTGGLHGLIAETYNYGNATPEQGSDIATNPSYHSTNGALYTDWRLPTYYELSLLYTARNTTGLNMNNGVYVSSTYIWSASYPYKCLNFSNGTVQQSGGNWDPQNVRAIRSF